MMPLNWASYPGVSDDDITRAALGMNATSTSSPGTADAFRRQQFASGATNNTSSQLSSLPYLDNSNDMSNPFSQSANTSHMLNLLMRQQRQQLAAQSTLSNKKKLSGLSRMGGGDPDGGVGGGSAVGMSAAAAAASQDYDYPSSHSHSQSQNAHSGLGPQEEEELILQLLMARRQRQMRNASQNQMLDDTDESAHRFSLANDMSNESARRLAVANDLLRFKLEKQQENGRRDGSSADASGRGFFNNSVPGYQHDAVAQKSDFSNYPLGSDLVERIDKAPSIGDATSMNAYVNNNDSVSNKRPLDQSKIGMYSNQFMDGYEPNKNFTGQMSNISNQEEEEEEEQPKKRKRVHKKKPADMPRRPLSAYNLFFSEERVRILKEIEGDDGAKEGTEEGDGGEKASEKPSDEKAADESKKPEALLRPLLPAQKKRRKHRKTHGKISFRLLAQKVGERWKNLDPERRKYYQDLAQEDMKRQKKAMEEFYQKQSEDTAGSKETAVETQE